MKQQIIVSGMGGQGVLFLTRIIAGAGVDMGLEIFTSETHGMAQRGGSVISTVKVGRFHSPLIRSGQGDVGIFLHPQNLPVHGHLLRLDARALVNTPEKGPWYHLDATAMATEMGSPVLANLILLGYGVGKSLFFCSPQQVESAIETISPERFVENNLKAFRRGLDA